MKTIGFAVLVWACCGAGALAGNGPDVLPSNINGVSKWGTVGGITAYSFNMDTCNVGTQPIAMVAGTPNRPVTTSNMYRLHDGRFEQIGQSWVFYSFCALQLNSCATCAAACGGCCSAIGIGCNDSNTATSVGTQSNLGPRSAINAFTAVYPANPASGSPSSSIDRRMQVHVSDFDAATYPGASYFVETQQLAPDDAAASNALNNISNRRVNVGAFNGTDYPLSFTAGMLVSPGQPAIMQWAAADSSVMVTPIDIPGEGRLYLASTAHDIGGGQWRYEYALYNFNSHDSARSFSVPMPSSASVSNLRFHDVAYHSGEPFDGTDWSGVANASEVSWNTDTFASNPNANALRWGTLYNFGFVSNQSPMSGNVTIGLFRSNTTVPGEAYVPAVPPPLCDGDTNGDNVVNAADLSVLLSNFGGAAFGAGSGDLNNDGQCNSADLSILLGNFGGSC